MSLLCFCDLVIWLLCVWDFVFLVIKASYYAWMWKAFAYKVIKMADLMYFIAWLHLRHSCTGFQYPAIGRYSSRGRGSNNNGNSAKDVVAGNSRSCFLLPLAGLVVFARYLVCSHILLVFSFTCFAWFSGWFVYSFIRFVNLTCFTPSRR